MAEEEGAYMLLTNCPSCILSLEKGLELMRESGEPVEFGIFDFYKVFSRAFGEEGKWGSWDLEWKVGYVAPFLPRLDWKSETSMFFGLLFISEVASYRRRCYKYCSFF